MDSLEGFKGSNALNQSKESHIQVNQPGYQMGHEEKKAAVDQEISRMNKLPSNSSYASHRLRVLNKILHLLAIQVCTNDFFTSITSSINLSLLGFAEYETCDLKFVLVLQ